MDWNKRGGYLLIERLNTTLTAPLRIPESPWQGITCTANKYKNTLFLYGMGYFFAGLLTKWDNGA